MWLPTHMIFSSSMILGIMMCLSANQWFMMWMGLELNMFAFLPLLSMSDNENESSTAPLYLAIQAIGSSLIMTSAVMGFSFMNSWSNLIFQLAIMMKLGGPPVFCWYPNMVSNLSWSKVWLLMTIQKINPILIITYTLKMSHSLVIIASLMALIGGVGGMIQTQIRGLMAYSSMTHMSWILILSIESTSLSSMYFLMYLIIVSSIIFILNQYNTKSHPNALFFHPYAKTTVILLLISLAGIPPMMGFLPKLQAIQSLINHTSIPIIIILILGSLMNLFFYLNLLLASSLSTSSNMKHHTITTNMSLLMPLATICFFACIPLMWNIL